MKISIGYFADGQWSHKAFQKIINDTDLEIKFICVRYDTTDTTLKEYAEHYNIAYLKHPDINTLEFIEKISVYQCDLFVSMSFNQIFRSQIINLPRLKTINCHAGKLPFYRGRNVLNWALINDESEFGITVHYMDEGIDTGDIILQRTYPISDQDDYASLLNLAYEECATTLFDALQLFKTDSVQPLKQSIIHPIGFYCSQRKIGDEKLSWNQTSREIFNFVRAICAPGPIARSMLHGKEMKINKVTLIQGAPNYKCIVGAILKKDANKFLVKTLDSFIEVSEYEYNSNFKVGDRFEII